MALAVTVPATSAVDPDVARKLGVGRRRVRRHVVRIALAIAAAGAVALGVSWWTGRNAPAASPYVTAPVERGPLDVVVTATGKLEARNVVQVGSEVSGRVARVHVDADDRVARGQILAEIDREALAASAEQMQAQLAQARARLVDARATQAEAHRNRLRADSLASQGVIPTAERDAAMSAEERADAAVAVARAAIKQATAAVHVAETNLARTVIRSPIDGAVLIRNVEEGQTVVAAFQAPVLFEIAEDLRAMRVSVDLDEADIAAVRAGETATFTVAAYLSREFAATVARVHSAARVVDRVVTYEAELDVDNHDLLLRPGMTVTARILAERVEDALLVPSQALRFAPKGTAPIVAGARIWVVRGGKPVEVAVEVGASDDLRSAVSGAVSPGEPVIVNQR